MVNETTQTTVSTQVPTLSRSEPSMSEAVVEAVADAKGISPSAVRPPLYEAIDPDALDDLFTSRFASMDRTDGRVVFPYCGYEVTVYGNGQVRVVDQSDRE